MKRFNYIALALAFFLFGSAVGASSLGKYDPLPPAERVVSYFNQAHAQDQAY
jgi:hypothetical protein